MSHIVVGGTGILGISDITLGALDYIRKSDVVFYLVADPLTEEFIIKNSKMSLSLSDCYVDGLSRGEAYNAMAERVVESAKSISKVCALFYGHPTVFVSPSRDIVRRAEAAGHSTTVLPGISAEDRLFADIGIDPSICGCQTYEATDFLIRERRVSPDSLLVIWQVGVIGDNSYKAIGYGSKNLRALADRLVDFYPQEHQVLLYEASQMIPCSPRIEWTALSDLPDARVTAITTLFVPAYKIKTINLDCLIQLQRSARTETL